MFDITANFEYAMKRMGKVAITFMSLVVFLAGCAKSYTIQEDSYTLRDRNYTFAIYNSENQLMTHPLKDLAHEVRRRVAANLAQISDIYVISHGWNFSATEAVANHHNFLQMIDCAMPISGPKNTENQYEEQCVPKAGIPSEGSFASFQPYFIFVTWTSTMRPLSETLQGILPFGFDKVLRFPAYLLDIGPIHFLTAWKQSLNAGQNALGSDFFIDNYFYDDQGQLSYGTESFYHKDASIGSDRPVSSLIYDLISAKKVKHNFPIHPCKQNQTISLNIKGVKLHLVGHSYGAKLVAFAGMEALRRNIFVDFMKYPPDPYTDWGKECLLTGYEEHLSSLTTDPERIDDELWDFSYWDGNRIKYEFGTGLPFLIPDESGAMEVVESFYSSLDLGKYDSLIESLVFINPAMHPDEFQYSPGGFKTNPASVLALIPRKAILYSKYDYPNGILFSTKEVILSAKSAQIFNFNLRWDIPILSQSLGVVGSALSLGYSLVYGVVQTTMGMVGNLPRDLWHHVKTHQFLGNNRPIDSQGFESGWLGFWNFLDFFAPVFPPFPLREEDDQGLFRLSRPGLGKTGLKKIANGRFHWLNLGGLTQFYEKSEDIDERTFCRFANQIRNDASPVDHDDTRQQIYSFNASKIYDSNLFPLVGSHGDLRSHDEVACEEAPTFLKQKREYTFNFLLNFTKTNFVKELENLNATQQQ